MEHRTLGRSDLAVAPIRLGGWPIGGPWATPTGQNVGYGHVDDAESIRALRLALERGITLFDTADAYGAGHSEDLIGQAFAGRRSRVVIATKFGLLFDEHRRLFAGVNTNPTPAFIRQACEASLRRLRTDYIDIYQLHPGEISDPGVGATVRDTLETLVTAGHIRWYGISSHHAAMVEAFAKGPHCISVQHRLNVVDADEDEQRMVSLSARLGLASLCNSPLASGLLGGAITAMTRFADDDIRGWQAEFQGDQRAARLQRFQQVREILTARGHTPAQGALAWIWTHSPHSIPIPGFKTVAQVEDLAGAREKGPLTAAQMSGIDEALGRRTSGESVSTTYGSDRP